MDTDRNLLFGVLVLQADLLDLTRFAEACTAGSRPQGWAAGRLARRARLADVGGTGGCRKAPRPQAEEA
jgi:hypothetical protein